MPRRYLPSSILSSFSVSSPQLLLRLHRLRGGKGGRTRSAQKTMLEMMMFSTSSSSSSGKKNNENENDGRKATNIDDEGDDEFSNYEDLMAMEDSYGSGVSASEHAAAEANAKLLQQRQKILEERAKRGIQPGDRVRVYARKGAPYPDLSKRKKYYNEGYSLMSTKTVGGASGDGGDDERKREANAESSKKKKRFDIRPVVGYVIEVRNDRVGVKRNDRTEDTDISYPTFPRSWVEQLDIGEMWEMNTGSRFQNTYGSFSSAEDAAFYQSGGASEGNEGKGVEVSDDFLANSM